MSAGGDLGNPLRKFKLVFLGEQSGESGLCVCVFGGLAVKHVCKGGERGPCMVLVSSSEIRYKIVFGLDEGDARNRETYLLWWSRIYLSSTVKTDHSDWHWSLNYHYNILNNKF